MYVQSFILWTWLAQRERTELAMSVTDLKVRRMCLEIKLNSWSVAGLKHRESLLHIKFCNPFEPFKLIPVDVDSIQCYWPRLLGSWRMHSFGFIKLKTLL